ncbi:MAG: hypothetical protein JW871_02560 [Endomicrobiales bacterium]|nr:hypothetical protein [Endomicrobiales bacterium]
MKTYKEIDEMTITDAIKEFDKIGKSTVDNLNFWSNEIFRKTLKKQNQEIRRFTLYILILTIINVSVFIYSMFWQ